MFFSPVLPIPVLLEALAKGDPVIYGMKLGFEKLDSLGYPTTKTV